MSLESDWEAAAPDLNAEWEKAKPTVKATPKSTSIISRGVGDNATLDTGMALVSGAAAPIIGGLAGLVGAAMPGPEGQGANFARRTQEALTYEPQTPIGKGVVKTISYPFEKLAEGADVAGGKVTDVTGSPLAGSAVNTAIQSIPMLVGKVSKKVAPGGELPSTVTARESAMARNALNDAQLQQAKDAGYVLPPTEVNPGIVNKTVEGIAGKTQTGQELSIRNQPVTNGLVRDHFAIPADTPITTKVLEDVRKQAGERYQDIRNEPGRIQSDPAYNTRLDEIAGPYRNAKADFPRAARNDVLKAIESIREDSFTASSALDQIKVLREKADTAYRSGDAGLGRTYKNLAGALEDQIGRFLDYVQAPSDMIAKFQKARSDIASSYTVQDHLKPNGNVDALGLARELEGGTPLQGNLKTVAEFASNYKKAAQLPQKVGGVPIGMFDAAIGLGSLATAIISGHPGVAAAAAIPFIRPALRSAMASGPYQNALVNPNYGSSLGAKLLSTQQNSLMPLAETSLGQ